MLIPVNTDSYITALRTTIELGLFQYNKDDELLVFLCLRKAEFYSRSGITSLMLTEEEFELAIDFYDPEC